jgi:hypothetical protein
MEKLDIPRSPTTEGEASFWCKTGAAHE